MCDASIIATTLRPDERMPFELSRVRWRTAVTAVVCVGLSAAQGTQMPPETMSMCMSSKEKSYIYLFPQMPLVFPMQAVDGPDYRVGKFVPTGRVAQPVNQSEDVRYVLTLETLVEGIHSAPSPWEPPSTLPQAFTSFLHEADNLSQKTRQNLTRPPTVFRHSLPNVFFDESYKREVGARRGNQLYAHDDLDDHVIRPITDKSQNITMFPIVLPSSFFHYVDHTPNAGSTFHAMLQSAASAEDESQTLVPLFPLVKDTAISLYGSLYGGDQALGMQSFVMRQTLFFLRYRIGVNVATNQGRIPLFDSPYVESVFYGDQVQLSFTVTSKTARPSTYPSIAASLEHSLTEQPNLRSHILSAYPDLTVEGWMAWDVPEVGWADGWKFDTQTDHWSEKSAWEHGWFKSGPQVEPMQYSHVSGLPENSTRSEYYRNERVRIAHAAKQGWEEIHPSVSLVQLRGQGPKGTVRMVALFGWCDVSVLFSLVDKYQSAYTDPRSDLPWINNPVGVRVASPEGPYLWIHPTHCSNGALPPPKTLLIMGRATFVSTIFMVVSMIVLTYLLFGHIIHLLILGEPRVGEVVHVQPVAIHIYLPYVWIPRMGTLLDQLLPLPSFWRPRPTPPTDTQGTGTGTRTAPANPIGAPSPRLVFVARVNLENQSNAAPAPNTNNITPNQTHGLEASGTPPAPSSPVSTNENHDFPAAGSQSNLMSTGLSDEHAGFIPDSDTNPTPTSVDAAAIFGTTADDEGPLSSTLDRDFAALWNYSQDFGSRPEDRAADDRDELIGSGHGVTGQPEDWIGQAGASDGMGGLRRRVGGTM